MYLMIKLGVCKHDVNLFFYVASKHTNIIDPINLYQQFYIDGNEERYMEIKNTLKKNVENKNIDTIFLLNEREYSIDELGIESDKIKQIIIGHRLKYEDFFKYSKDHSGYLVFANSDIYFDDSIKNLYCSNIDKTKKCYCLLRFEKNGELYCNNFKEISDEQKEMKFDLTKLKFSCHVNNTLYKAYPYSSDTWIIHSNFNKNIKNMDIPLGVSGCDNRFHYEMMMNGFDIMNEPYFIKTYHNHKSNARNYDKTEALKGNYLCIVPNLKPFKQYFQ